MQPFFILVVITESDTRGNDLLSLQVDTYIKYDTIIYGSDFYNITKKFINDLLKGSGYSFKDCQNISKTWYIDFNTVPFHEKQYKITIGASRKEVLDEKKRHSFTAIKRYEAAKFKIRDFPIIITPERLEKYVKSDNVLEQQWAIEEISGAI